MIYYVLRDNILRARSQFKDAIKMMQAFEHWFGPYPFYEDSFKIVEVPYLGMEHQSSITYGNKYQNGYLGRDLSGSGWGLKFDFISQGQILSVPIVILGFLFLYLCASFKNSSGRCSALHTSRPYIFVPGPGINFLSYTK